MTDAYDHFQQGKAHLKDGMAAQATVALEKAKKLEPDKASIREALGIAYFRIQRWKEAEAEFRAVLESRRPTTTPITPSVARSRSRAATPRRTGTTSSPVALAVERALRRADHAARRLGGERAD